MFIEDGFAIDVREQWLSINTTYGNFTNLVYKAVNDELHSKVRRK